MVPEASETRRPVAAPVTGRRRALVVATSNYADPTLRKLRAPGQDAAQLAEVLGDEAIGRFEVETVLDAPSDVVRRRVVQFCARGEPHDLALVYLSCHGVLDDRGRLYYATADTERELLSVTAVPAAWLIEHLEDCKCRQQILVLDCCHSGAFARGAKGSNSDLALRERVEGRGRVVLTASRATEYSFEGTDVVGEGTSSVFTGALVAGLRTGDADADGDGRITVTELYDYAYSAVKGTDASQNPNLWSFGAEGSLLVAHSPLGAIVAPAMLPEHVTSALENPRPQIRVAAVAELAEILHGDHPGRALTAREQLEQIATNDVPLVASAARRVLDPAPSVSSTAPLDRTGQPPTPPAEQPAPGPLIGSAHAASTGGLPQRSNGAPPWQAVQPPKAPATLPSAAPASVRPESPTRASRPARPPSGSARLGSGRLRLAVIAVPLLAAGVIAVYFGVTPGPRPVPSPGLTPPSPSLSQADVTKVLNGYVAAYNSRSGPALRLLLDPGVIRTADGGQIEGIDLVIQAHQKVWNASGKILAYSLVVTGRQRLPDGALRVHARYQRRVTGTQGQPTGIVLFDLSKKSGVPLITRIALSPGA